MLHVSSKSLIYLLISQKLIEICRLINLYIYFYILYFVILFILDNLNKIWQIASDFL